MKNPSLHSFARKLFLLGFAFFLAFSANGFFASRQIEASSAPITKDQLDESKALRLTFIEEWAKTFMERHQIPGAAISIVHKDQILWNRGFGYQNSKTGVFIDDQSLFRLCSLVKPFTAIGVKILEQRDEIKPSDPIVKFVPELGWSHENAPTIQDILLHLGGLQEDAPFPYFTSFDYPTKEELLASLPSLEPTATPGAEYRYSNLGYMLLGLATERASGENWEDFLKREVLSPLGMGNAQIDLDPTSPPETLVEGRTIPSKDGTREIFRPYEMLSVSPAGGLLASSSDLANFMLWHFATLAGQNSDILQPETLAEMLSPVWQAPDQSRKRGLGYGFYKDGDNTFVGHGGYCAGYRTFMMLDLENEIGISVQINVNDASPYDFAFGIHGLLTMEVPGNSSPTQVPNLADYTGVFDRAGMPERTQVVQSGHQLLVLNLFTDNPAGGLQVFEGIDDTTFRNIQDPTHTVEFEKDDTGQVYRYWPYPTFHYLAKIREEAANNKQ